jgi:CMP-N,N'-diacetyllegionaminic acid synthase
MKIFDYLKSDFLVNNNYLKKEDTILMLLPTQPYRSLSQVEEMINYYKKEHLNVFSCREYSFPLSFSFEINPDNSIKPIFDDSPLFTGNTRSQDQIAYYHPDGSVYLISISSLKKNNNSIYQAAQPYILNNENYIDINNESDLLLAQSLNSDVISK